MPCTPATAVAAITAALEAQANPERAERERRYLRSRLHHLGVRVPSIRRVAEDHRRLHPDAAPAATWAVAQGLWKEPVHEHRMCAAELLRLGAARLTAADLEPLEQMLRQSRTWALVDNLAIHVAGPVAATDPAAGAVLDRWAEEEDFWLRRSALLALLLPLRRGGGDFERFGRYADGMLEEREFFIRKAIGWVLRETGKKRPERVRAWLLPRIGRTSGLTLREALKPLPEEMRRELQAEKPRHAATNPRISE